jgi:hypothetical protein
VLCSCGGEITSYTRGWAIAALALVSRRGAQPRHSYWHGTVQALPSKRRDRAQPPETLGRSPRESQTDRSPLSGGHARRLRALTLAAHLLAWKLETT